MTPFDPSLLPPRPILVPDELRALGADTTAAGATVPAASVAMFIAAVTQWLSHPRMGVSVELTTHDDGWTIDVRRPAPRNDVILPGHNSNRPT